MAGQTVKIRLIVEVLKDFSPVSLQYWRYWSQILEGIIDQIAFGVSSMQPSESFTNRCPNGRSWTT